jgi:hypothetical protein
MRWIGPFLKLHNEEWPFGIDNGLGIQQRSIGTFFGDIGLLRHLCYLLLHCSQLAEHHLALFGHDIGLSSNGQQGNYGAADANCSNHEQSSREYHVKFIPPVFATFRHGSRFADDFGLLCLGGGFGLTLILIFAGFCLCFSGWMRTGWVLMILGIVCDVLSAATLWIGCLPWDWWHRLHDGQEHSEREYFHGDKLYHRKYLTRLTLCNTVNGMANVLNTDKQIAVIGGFHCGM